VFKQQIKTSVAALVMLLIGTGSAWALDPIPTESGFSGRAQLMLGVTDSETNLMKGSSLWDLGAERASALDSGADDEDDTFPLVGAHIAYTFGNRNQVYLEGDVGEIVTMELLSEIGFRKQFETLGIVSLGLLTNGLLKQETWRDPYDTTVSSRSDSDFDSSGVRFQWGWIGDIPIEFEFKYLERDVDKERSGAALVAANAITAQQAQLLERDGDDYQGELRYVWRNEGWALIPYIGYTSADRDGDAIKYDGWHGGLNGGWRNENWIIGGGVKLGSKSSDAANPVFNERVDGDFYEIALSVDYKLPFFGGENWYASGVIAYADEDAEVEFHDQTNLLFAAGLEWRFGQDR
jgi:hypothetical protein